MDLFSDISNLSILLLAITILLYSIISIFIYFMMINNIFIFKKNEPIFPFFIEKRRFITNENKQLVYWVLKLEPKDQKQQRWVVFFHYYGGNSGNMVKRSEPYLKNGFCLLFIDARSHGSSSWSSTSNAYTYATDTLEIIEYEGIKELSLHGVSMGGYCALIVYKIIQETGMSLTIRSLVIEAISSNLKNILWDLLEYSPFPKTLFAWIPNLIYFQNRNFDWDNYAPENIIRENYHVPLFLIHGENDRLYDKKQFYILESISKGQFHNSCNNAWLVEKSDHLSMDQHPQYFNRITFFLTQVFNRTRFMESKTKKVS